MPSYPIDLPSSPSPRDVTVRLNERVSVSTSPFTGRTQAFAHPGGYWEVTFDLPPLTPAQATAWTAALISLRGEYGTFKLSPYWGGGQPNYGSSPTLTSVQDSAITFAGNAHQTLSPGDWIQIDGGLYRVTVVDSSAAEVAPLPRFTLSDANQIEWNDPVGVFRLLNPVEYVDRINGTTTTTIAAREIIGVSPDSIPS